jgi:hypothetical protein
VDRSRISKFFNYIAFLKKEKDTHPAVAMIPVDPNHSGNGADEFFH